MDFQNIEEVNEGILLKNVKNFDVVHIFECGQCFRWAKQESGSYIGVAYGKVIEIESKGNDIFIGNTNLEEFNNIWINYFDLERDYTKIKIELSKDSLLKKSVEFGYGIRLLKQEPFELIISFIISSNNRIPMIKKVIDNICRLYGNKIIYKEKEYFTFPDTYQLHTATLEELQGCSAGFRAKYIFDTVDYIYKNKECINNISAREDDACHIELQKLKGIGPKVADCIMLFSMGKYSAFPVDVWVKRAMQTLYLAPDVSLKGIREYGREKFGKLSGFAQQYLFYYARENKIKLE
jgi:N-glycosylase/DNA lyase